MDVDTKPVKQDKKMFSKLEQAKAKLDDNYANWDIGTGGSIGCTPLIKGDRIYFGSCNHYIYCLRTETGEKIWEYRTGGVVMSSPYISNGMLYEGSYDNHMYALNAATGELVWKFRANNIIVGTPVEYSGRLYFGCLDDYFYCVDAKDGTLKWKHYCPEGSVATPIIFNNCVLFTAYDKYLWCLDAENGKVVWKYFMKIKGSGTPLLVDEKGKTIANSIVCGPVKIKDGRIVFTTWHGRILVLDLNGSELNEIRLGNDAIESGLSANKGMYFTSFDTNIYFISPEGDIWWRYKTGQSIEATPIIVGDTLFVGSGDQNAYALDAKTGRLKWSFHTGGMVFGSCAYSNGRLYFGSWDGNMYCLDVDKKIKVWHFSTGSLGQASVLGVDLNDEEERIAFAMQTGMERDLAYKMQSDEEHGRIGFNPYLGEDERNPYLSIGKDNPYVSRRRREGERV